MEAALCRIEVLRIFRQKIRNLCPNNQPCLRVCVERPVDLILQLSGIPSFWHPDQLHLAEWQAMQQLEFIFNVTLSVDAKNMALAKLASIKVFRLLMGRCLWNLHVMQPVNPLSWKMSEV